MDFDVPDLVTADTRTMKQPFSSVTNGPGQNFPSLDSWPQKTPSHSPLSLTVFIEVTMALTLGRRLSLRTHHPASDDVLLGQFDGHILLLAIQPQQSPAQGVAVGTGENVVSVLERGRREPRCRQAEMALWHRSLSRRVSVVLRRQEGPAIAPPRRHPHPRRASRRIDDLASHNRFRLRLLSCVSAICGASFCLMGRRGLALAEDQRPARQDQNGGNRQEGPTPTGCLGMKTVRSNHDILQSFRGDFNRSRPGMARIGCQLRSSSSTSSRHRA